MKAFSIAIALLLCGHICAAEQNWLDQYNVIWESHSQDHTGQMPLGNGDIAAGVYAIENDAIYMLLAKNDAFSYNGDIFKTGRVKIALDPNPFEEGKPFEQTLDLKTGSIRIKADAVEILVWADANRPVYHVQIDAPYEITVTASADPWERFDTCGRNRTAEPIDPPTQDVLLARNGHVLWYYAVGDRSVYPTELAFYEAESAASEYPDPYRFNTFGNLLESPELELQGDILSGSGQRFDIRIHASCDQEPDIDQWIADLESQAEEPIDVRADWQAHSDWWSDFWSRSWITISDNTIAPTDRGRLDHEGYITTREVKDGGALVAQSYNVFRYLMACQSRGRVQSKFNGGLFTQPLRYQPKRYNDQIRLNGHWEIDGELFISHEDDRLWARRFTFQNQRLLYWPLLMSGDGDLMQPFFRYYFDMLPVRRAINKSWFGHDGVYFRENIEPTGGERDCGPSARKDYRLEDKPLKTPPGGNTAGSYHHSYYFTSGLETTAMMIDYAKHTEDTQFRDELLVPFAREILTFYDQHYGRDEDGKLRLDPAQALETWWVAINPATDVSGLLHVLDELLAMEVGTDEDRTQWKRLRSEMPEVHLHEIDGRLAIAPGLEFGAKHNAENAELYPVFPFRRFGLGRGNVDILKWTMEHRTNKNAFKYGCWTQDQIMWAYAGNAAQAKDGLVHRFSKASTMCRFPVYGTEGPDSCPDLDHFGSGSTALQRMLAQEVDGKILLLPAWPKEWDTDFKLHLEGNTVITGTVKDGELRTWNIVPPSRANDVIVHEPQ